MVRVDELFRVTAEGEIQSRKDVQYNAVLTDWIRLIGLKAIKPAPQADGDPTIGGTLKQLFRAEGDMSTKESLALNITCTVADIRPNGDVVLEGHKEIKVNYESWSASLSGICRYQDIGPDNTVLSKNIANLEITELDSGHVRDSYKRGWLSRWIDEWSPFCRSWLKPPPQQLLEKERIVMIKLNRTIRSGLVCSAVLMAITYVSSAQAQFLRIGDICALKGQEENTLLGRGWSLACLGLVIRIPPRSVHCGK